MLSLVPAKSRAVLIAASRFPRDNALLPLPAVLNNVADLVEVLVAPTHIGLPSHQVVVINDEPSASNIAETIDEVGREAEDCLLLYYAGHGLVSRSGDLLLATSGSTQAGAQYNALPLATLKAAVLASPAAKHIIILDCCFSGRAVQLMTETQSLLRAELDVRGTFAIASAPANKPAMAPEGARNTAFTGELLRILKHGVDNGHEALDLDELYELVRSALLRDGQPEPQRMNSINVRPFHFCRNRYYTKDSVEIDSLKEAIRHQAAEIDRLSQVVERYESGLTVWRDNPEDAFRRIVRGFTRISNLVRPTLGPHSKPVVVSGLNGPPASTHDSLVIASRTKLTDPLEQVGANLARDLAKLTRVRTGDGFASAFVITERLLTLASGRRDAEDLFSLSEGIRLAAASACDALAAQRLNVDGRHQLIDLVRTAGGDPEIAEVVADAIDQSGVYGDVVVEMSGATGLEVEFAPGIGFDTGYLSPYFATDAEAMTAVLKKPYVLLTTSPISAIGSLLPILEEVMKAQGALLVVAPDVFGEALATLVFNKLRGTVLSVAVRAPSFGERSKSMLQDIATITDAQVFGEEVGLRCENANLGMLGRAQFVVSSPDSTTIVRGGDSEEQVRERIRQIRSVLHSDVASNEREFLQERLGKLAAGVALIKLGGDPDEPESRDRRVLVERSARLLRSALLEGIVPGGGVSLERCQDALASPAPAPSASSKGSVIA
jgi:chaperonin GroEL